MTDDLDRRYKELMVKEMEEKEQKKTTKKKQEEAVGRVCLIIIAVSILAILLPIEKPKQKPDPIQPTISQKQLATEFNRYFEEPCSQFMKSVGSVYHRGTVILPNEARFKRSTDRRQLYARLLNKCKGTKR